MRLRIIRLDGKGLVVTGHSLIKLPLAIKRGAEVGMRLSVIRLDGKGLHYEINGNIVFANLMSD